MTGQSSVPIYSASSSHVRKLQNNDHYLTNKAQTNSNQLIRATDLGKIFIFDLSNMITIHSTTHEHNTKHEVLNKVGMSKIIILILDINIDINKININILHDIRLGSHFSCCFKMTFWSYRLD